MSPCGASEMSPPAPRPDRPVGLYLHVPFCGAKCPYCNYPVDVDPDHTTSRHFAYADALIDEYEARRHVLKGRDVRSLYIGGGTPSHWQTDALEHVLQRVSRDIELASLDVTLEANPCDIDGGTLDAWQAFGIDRLNIGVQSFQTDILERIGRRHDPSRAEETLAISLDRDALRVGCDLLFGVPGQSLSTWRRDVDAIAALDPLTHVTAYEFELDDSTPMGERDADDLARPSSDERLEMLEMAADTWRKQGFERHEIGSFARREGASRHTTLYWTGGEYLGLGMGAHSLTIAPSSGVVRRVNPADLETYLASPADSGCDESIEPSEYLLQRLSLAMRTTRGLEMDVLRHQFEGAVSSRQLEWAREALDQLVDRGVLCEERSHYRPTDRGLHREDGVARWLARRFPTDS